VTIAGKIKAKLSQLSAQYTLVTDSNGLPTGYSHETVLGDPVFPPYRTVTNHTLLINQYVLNTTIRDGHVINNWDQYADLLLYASLSCHWTGNDSEATGYLNDAARMWNSTAQGIQDIAFKGTYDTYKLALLLYTAEVLGEKLPFEAQLVNRIYMQQNQTSGGIITDYTANGSTVGDSNTETTSIAIVALLTSPTMTSPSPPKPPTELPIWVIVSLPVMLAIAMFVAFRVMREKRANDNCWNA
jgi:hypothetical protein